MKEITMAKVLISVAALAAAVLVALVFKGPPVPEVPQDMLQINPTPAEKCGPPPSPEDWKVMRDDGTTDAEQVTAFAKHISEWDECITEYADSLSDYIYILEGLRDSTVEAAGSYFHQFVDPTLPDPHGVMPPPGVFQEYEAPPSEFMPWLFDTPSQPWIPQRKDI